MKIDFRFQNDERNAMRIISKPVGLDTEFSLPDVPAGALDVLFLDIETTGISREKKRGLSDRLHLHAAGGVAADPVVRRHRDR